MDARTLAARVLLRVEEEDAFASAVLSAAIAREAGLDPRDRGLATELVYGVLRWRGILDDAIATRTPRGIAGLDALVRIHLEIATYQVLRHDRIPKPAAVSAAVEKVKGDRGARMAGFANAVLRGIARDAKVPDEDARARLALPAWLLSALARDLGEADARAIALASLEPAPVWVRPNVRRTSPEDLARRLRREHGAKVTVHDGGALRVEADGDVQSLPSFAEGLFTVQDAGAQAIAALVEPKPGERILDACAGRGGKTGALVERAGGGAQIDAADDQPAKLQRLAAEMKRLGHGGVQTVAVDLAVGAAGLRPPYDAALVDAPCTGTGVLARRPELRWRLREEDAERLAALQRTILARVASLVRPGGRIVYAVCSLLEPEGGAVARSIEGAVVRDEKRWLPHRDGTDGFYAAVLERGA